MGRNVIGGTLGMSKCHNLGGNQNLVLKREKREFRKYGFNDLCISMSTDIDAVGKAVTWETCNDQAYQKWSYVGCNLNCNNIKPESNTKLCLDSKHYDSTGLTVELCNSSGTQNFTFAETKQKTLIVDRRVGAKIVEW